MNCRDLSEFLGDYFAGGLIFFRFSSCVVAVWTDLTASAWDGS